MRIVSQNAARNNKASMKNVACQNRAIESIVRNSKQAEDTA